MKSKSVVWGLICGLIFSIYNLALVLFDAKELVMGTSGFWINLLVNVILVLAFGFTYKKDTEGAISYRQAFKNIFTFQLVSSTLSVVTAVLLFLIIFPDFGQGLEQFYETLVNQKLDEQQVYDDEKREAAMKFSMMTYPYNLPFGPIIMFVGAVIISLVISVIAAIFVYREGNPAFLTDDDAVDA